MSKKHKKVLLSVNCIEHLFSAVTEWFSISAFACLVGIPIGITSSAIGLKICVIAAGVEKYKSIIKEKKKKHDKILSLAQNLN